ncbi:aquaporin [Kitasatospora sp. NPDC059571]|uniref:aquaporin n=1 Tax=Kitasatospora sp. NPDC059571 TaxID=3346871 RepID=UPI00368EE382
MTNPLFRRLAAEAVGTAVLAAVVAGSGLAAGGPGPGGGRPAATVLAPVLALGMLLTLLAPVSGAHFNPLVSITAWWARRRQGGGPAARDLAPYAAAQLAGAVAGTALADAMFGRPLLAVAQAPGAGGRLWLAEAVATGVLVLLVAGLTRSGRERYAPAAVAAWVAAACWGTSSGAFVNPALTAARSLGGAVGGISPGAVPGFVLAQCAGAAVGLALAAVLFGAGAARRAEAPAVAGAGAAGPVDRACGAEPGGLREPVGG